MCSVKIVVDFETCCNNYSNYYCSLTTFTLQVRMRWCAVFIGRQQKLRVACMALVLMFDAGCFMIIYIYIYILQDLLISLICKHGTRGATISFSQSALVNVICLWQLLWFRLLLVLSAAVLVFFHGHRLRMSITIKPLSLDRPTPCLINCILVYFA